MAEKLCNLVKSDGEEWTSIGEITTTTTESSTAIDMSSIPSSAKEVLVELGMKYSGNSAAMQSHVVPYSHLSSVAGTFWSYAVSGGFAFFSFNYSEGKIKNFIPYGIVTQVYVNVYYK